MITIDIERCTGCGACVEACPTGALFLVNGKAAVDDMLCRRCEACVGVCPLQAIVLSEQPERVPERTRQLTLRPEPEIIQIRTEAMPVPLRARVLPVMGAALAWAGHEIVPRLVDAVLDAVERRPASGQAAAAGRNNTTLSQRRGGQGQGRQHRRRRRGRG